MSVATPLFFGPPGRGRFGLLDWPDGPVRGAAVLCPPLGYEEVCAHTALRHLAAQLAAAGVVTLRIDYDGTGHSIGEAGDPDRVASWGATITDAVELLAGCGLPSVTLVGLRFGATLAAVAARSTPTVSALVLWDPIVSGRRYARSLQLFSAAGGHESTAGGGIAIAGVEFDAPTLADMGRTSIGADDLAVACLVVARTEAETEATALVADAAANVELRSLTGTTALLDTDAELSQVPHELITEIAAWVATRAVDPIEPQPARPLLDNETNEYLDGGGTVLRHRAMRVGPAGLLAVETARAGATATNAIVTLNNGVARSIGPGRAWVELGTELATAGVRVVRLDLSGLGDSPARPGRVENDTYAPTAADDLGALIDALRADGVSRVTALGLCSGALSNIDAALGRPEIDVVVSVNGRFDRPFTDRRRDRGRRAAGQTNRLLAVPLHKTPLLPLFEKVPTFVWRALDRLHIVASPTVAIERVVARGVRVVLVFGSDEWGLRALRIRGGRRFARLVEHPLVSVEVVDGLDHSMFDLEAQARARALIRARLVDAGVAEPELEPREGEYA